MSEPGRRIHIAAIHANDGIRLLSASECVAEVDACITAHVAAQADYLLRPADAEHVHELLERGQSEDAVAMYFDRVGIRWEREYLHRVCMPARNGQGPRAEDHA